MEPSLTCRLLSRCQCECFWPPRSASTTVWPVVHLRYVCRCPILLSILCADFTGLALTIDNAWIAFGGSLQLSVLNGCPPGILYEYIVACTYYAFIGASIAELASAIPSSGGVYHWASVTAGPKYGRVLGFFTGESKEGACHVRYLLISTDCTCFQAH